MPVSTGVFQTPNGPSQFPASPRFGEQENLWTTKRYLKTIPEEKHLVNFPEESEIKHHALDKTLENVVFLSNWRVPWHIYNLFPTSKLLKGNITWSERFHATMISPALEEILLMATHFGKTYEIYGGFLKWWYPTIMFFFLLKMIILGCFGGTTILGKHPYEIWSFLTKIRPQTSRKFVRPFIGASWGHGHHQQYPSNKIFS